MVLLRLKPKWQTDNEFSTFALLCLNLNRSAHHIHNILGNGHAKPCTLSPADCGSALSLKRRKNLLYKFRTHSDSIILYPDLVQFNALYRPRELLQPDRNRSSCGSKLNCI